ncbi:MAG: hypothetical protein OXO49_02660 [Gammaproteobacteria bacterium]|nr:hypothetical protein [Gammaproteobacteria bacterium]MDE0253010.1 hypothetical protein [Gammaproteobacteria bacterium]MDE0402346.1 hypothetical protein [Gammaproteobacteria bacterium]
MEIKTIGSHISKNLIAGQQGFSGAWRECNYEFRKTFHPILEEHLLTYVRDLADYLDYAIEKSEDFDVGQKYQAINADEFEKFRQERQKR